ncbi:MAG: hypothetical protein H7096_13910 [Flavobacterium sp.]|nr:hypothetical protein [Pedobacter sp.]
METQNEPENNYSYFYILAVIFGVLTAWIVTGSILYMLLGAFLGLLTAAFFVNVLVRKREN